MDAKEIQKIIAEKVEGKIEPAHDAFGHHYRFLDSGRVVDSVTTKLILEQTHLRKYAAYEALRWMENRWPLLTEDNKSDYYKSAALAHEDNRDEAGAVGTQAHNAIESYVKDWISSGVRPEDIRTFLKPEDDPRAVAAARSAEKIFKEEKAVPLATEILVGDEKVGCAGTLDMLVIKEDIIGFPEIELWDWKSSNNVGDKFALQVSAYKYFFEKMTGLKIFKSRIMHLSKDMDKVTPYTIPDLPRAYKAFKGISLAYDWRENGRKKLIKEVTKNIWMQKKDEKAE